MSLPPADPILTITDAAKSFGGLAAVAHASFGVARGSITALIGPNGAGKTTMFDLISGFSRPDAGAIVFDGRPITGLKPHAVCQLGLVRTFQLTRVFTGMTVLDNMMLAAPRQPGEHLPAQAWHPLAARQRERAVRRHAIELLDLFGLEAQAGAYAGTLSGGQRKLLEFARALMTGPRLILLDEPMAGVNPTLGRRLLDHIEAERRAHDLTFLFVEHDMEVVMNRADWVIVMAQGAVIAEGPPAKIRADPKVIDAYLGAASPP